MGRQQKERSCRGHPTHKQSNGVCPHCLRDRLSSFSSSSSSSRTNGDSSTDSSSAYSSYDSELSSMTASPGSEWGNSRENFGKSKRFALEKEGEQGKKRFLRFWGKIMMAGGGRKKERGEKIIKEKSFSRWTFFS